VENREEEATGLRPYAATDVREMLKCGILWSRPAGTLCAAGTFGQAFWLQLNRCFSPPDKLRKDATARAAGAPHGLWAGARAVLIILPSDETGYRTDGDRVRASANDTLKIAIAICSAIPVQPVRCCARYASCIRIVSIKC
jgi:hypothetical protein